MEMKILVALILMAVVANDDPNPDGEMESPF